MNQFIYPTCLMIIASILFCTHSKAANLCATNSNEFQAALDTAESNGEDDHITLQQGSYPIINGSPFSYNPDVGEDFDLKITGGYIDFFGSPCVQIDPNSALETELDGMSLNRVLDIRPVGNSKIEIAALYFLAGDATEAIPTRGGGLYISGSAHSGVILIENNAFVANDAQFGSALSASGADIINVRNNLFIGNSAESGAAVELVNNLTGMYFTNNTVMTNNTNGTNFNTAAVSLGTGSSTTKAFIANNILWNNEFKDLSFTPQTYLYNNDIGTYSGTPFDENGNFSEEPEFQSGLLNFTPTYTSNLYNQGIEPPIFVPVPIPFESNWDIGDNDTLGMDRKVNGRVDIGSFETPPEPPIFMNGFEEINN